MLDKHRSKFTLQGRLAFLQREETLPDGGQRRLPVLFKPPRLVLTFQFLLAGGEIARQPAQAPASVGPDPAKLEEDCRIGSTLRISEQAFELLKSLLAPKDRPLLLPKLVPQPLAFALQLGKLTFELGPVPEQAQEPIVIDRFAAGKELLGSG
jgi:hypothetical protein